jgi:hypothetical protein
MATPSGTISLNDVNVELGLAGTTTISMNQTNVRTLAGVGGSGTTISMQNLQNKSNRVTASATISANTSNYILNTAKATGYSAGTTDMTLTINSGVFVSSSSTGSYALQVDTSWAAGDTVTIVNNGTIIGRGGDGGRGYVNSPALAGSGAGPALLVQRALIMNNLNRISGGGGGGGGGAFGYGNVGKATYTGSGGGGGGGIGNSSGGQGGFGAQGGGSGTLTSAGGGGAGQNGGSGVIGGSGGAGGSYGSSGSVGGNATVSSQGGASAVPGGAGAAGACIVGNSNITYINTGTRNGSIS